MGAFTEMDLTRREEDEDPQIPPAFSDLVEIGADHSIESDDVWAADDFTTTVVDGQRIQQSAKEAVTQKSESPAVNKKEPDAPPDEEQTQEAQEKDETKRQLEWEAKRAEKLAAEEEQLRRISLMGADELLSAAAKRINSEAERLTRRNMKEFVAEHLQTISLDDLDFARLTMHPRKSFMRCIRFINRKAREYLQQEMKDNGMQPIQGADGIYGGDVPDDLVFSWAEEYYRDPDAEEDKEEDAKFVPKSYGSQKSSGKKRHTKKSEVEQKKEETVAVKKEAPKKTEDEAQISLGAFFRAEEKAS